MGLKSRWFCELVSQPVCENALYLNPDADIMSGLGDMSMSAANTHVIKHAGKILALEEGHWPFEVSNDLETVGPHNYGGKLSGADDGASKNLC